MSTPNFARPSNASKYYVVLTGYEENKSHCNECGEEHWEYEEEYVCSEGEPCTHCGSTDVIHEEEYRYPDDWAYDDLVGNIGSRVKELGGTPENESIESGSYSISSLGVFKHRKWYGEVPVTVIFTLVVQSAYYEGATLDWLVHVEGCCDTYRYSTGSSYDESLDDIMDMVFDPDYVDMNAGLCTIMKPKAKAWAERQIEELTEMLEKLCAEWSDHKLHCAGVFSNGEAVYTKAD